MNSNKFQNREVWDQYKHDNPGDEIASLFPDWGGGKVKIPCGKHHDIIDANTQLGTQIHHIAGACAGMNRWDIVSNLIKLSLFTHAFVETYKFDGFALCMAAKILKGEWDNDEMKRIMHVDPEDWIETKEFVFPWTYATLQCARFSIHRGHE